MIGWGWAVAAFMVGGIFGFAGLAILIAGRDDRRFHYRDFCKAYKPSGRWGQLTGWAALALTAPVIVSG